MSDLPGVADEDAVTATSAVAARMRAAREAAGMTLKDVADTTRVPLRHLASIEAGDFGALPGTTYVSGFARAYARAVGMDEAALVADLRTEIGEAGGLGHSPYEFEEAVNPARIPPRWLAWAAALIVILLAAGYGIWRMQLTTPPTDDQIAAQTEEQPGPATVQNAAAKPAPAPVTGPVIMTAADDVWIRIYQPDGTRLYEGTLKKGDSYTVPDNARDPMILTGRPDALAVTVGGQAIPPLGPPERTISDVPVSAAALIARAKQPAPVEDNAAAPVPGNASAPAAATTTTPKPVAKARPARPASPARTAPAGNGATP
jgi:cytoskeleton protein RodZ